MSKKYSGYSYDIDSKTENSYGYDSKTDYRSDGTVHQYDSDKGNWSNHSHTTYNSGKDHAMGNSSWSRDNNHPDSKDRAWKNRTLFLNNLSKLSFVELQELELFTSNEYIRRSAKQIINYKTSYIG